MNMYELINPHDEIVFEAKNDFLARATVLIVGVAYGAREISSGEIILPPLLFYGEQNILSYLNDTTNFGGVTFRIFTDNTENLIDISYSLNSFRHTREATSLCNPVKVALSIAKSIKKYLG